MSISQADNYKIRKLSDPQLRQAEGISFYSKRAFEIINDNYIFQ